MKPTGIKSFLFTTENSVWGEVNTMPDSVSVEYRKLEELFAQKSSHDSEDKHEENKVLKRQSAFVEVRPYSSLVFLWNF